MGVEPIQRRSGGPFLEHGCRDGAKMIGDEMKAPVEFGYASRRRTVSRAHLGNQESTVLDGQKVVGDARFEGFRGEQKPRLGRISYVEKEYPILPLQHAEQATASQNSL